MNVFKKQKIRQKISRVMEYLVIGMLVFVAVVAFVNAYTPDYQQKKQLAQEYQAELHSKANGIRLEINAYEGYIERLENDLAVLKAEYHRQEGMINVYNDELGLSQEQ